MQFSDNDECVDSPDCSEHAQCFNTGGSYTCMCHDGFYGDGKNCEGKTLHNNNQLLIYYNKCQTRKNWFISHISEQGTVGTITRDILCHRLAL